jgi:tRNA threonylcarbamoyl adenosine modification protein (Sua5/YciO/YrdC/YwlC family)
MGPGDIASCTGPQGDRAQAARIVSAHGDPPPTEAVSLAVEALRGGAIVGLPTDTIYGLAVDPFSAGASARLFDLKGRPRSVGFPVLVADEDQALALCATVTAAARSLMTRFWPGPLTLVLARRPGLNFDLGSARSTIGVRCPAHPLPLAICRELGPIATTSANRHGGVALTTASSVAASLGTGVAMVLDAGRCDAKASSVVDCTGSAPKLLREGPVSAADVAGTVA